LQKTSLRFCGCLEKVLAQFRAEWGICWAQKELQKWFNLAPIISFYSKKSKDFFFFFFRRDMKWKNLSLQYFFKFFLLGVFLNWDLMHTKAQREINLQRCSHRERMVQPALEREPKGYEDSSLSQEMAIWFLYLWMKSVSFVILLISLSLNRFCNRVSNAVSFIISI